MSPTRAHAVGAAIGLGAAAHRELLLRVGQLALELACARRASCAMRAGHVFERHFKFRRRRLGELDHVLRGLARGRAGQRLDAAHAGGDAAVGDDGDQADVAGAPHMRAAAQLDRPAERVADALTHRDDAHLVAVFLAEQRARAGGPRVVERHQPRRHRRVLQHDSRWRCPRPARSPRAVIGLGCEKSKRSRSGATSEPFCAT